MMMVLIKMIMLMMKGIIIKNAMLLTKMSFATRQYLNFYPKKNSTNSSNKIFKSGENYPYEN